MVSGFLICGIARWYQPRKRGVDMGNGAAHRLAPTGKQPEGGCPNDEMWTGVEIAGLFGCSSTKQQGASHFCGFPLFLFAPLTIIKYKRGPFLYPFLKKKVTTKNNLVRIGFALCCAGAVFLN